jgi:uncharacterized Tic20 family protein
MTEIAIPPEDRALAAMTHLSGLAGYIIPLGGVLVPIIIWMTKKDAPIISAIARQAVLLNVTVFALIVVSVVMWITIILIPFMVVFAILLGLAAIALPIIGAIKANGGVYYRYPVVGSNP